MVEKTMYEVVDEFISRNNLRFELDTKGLQQLVDAMGYSEDIYAGFLYHGDPITAFLSDNPGAQEAIVNWIQEQHIPEWKEALEECADEQK